MERKIKVLLTLLTLILIAFTFYFISYIITKYTGYTITGKIVYSKQEKMMLGECLRDKEVKLYCSSLSLNCQRQMSKLGLIRNYLDYIECSKNFEECEGLNLPSWRIGNKIYYGIYDLDKLAKISNCKIR